MTATTRGQSGNGSPRPPPQNNNPPSSQSGQTAEPAITASPVRESMPYVANPLCFPMSSFNYPSSESFEPEVLVATLDIVESRLAHTVMAYVDPDRVAEKVLSNYYAGIPAVTGVLNNPPGADRTFPRPNQYCNYFTNHSTGFTGYGGGPGHGFNHSMSTGPPAPDNPGEVTPNT